MQTSAEFSAAAGCSHAARGVLLPLCMTAAACQLQCCAAALITLAGVAWAVVMLLLLLSKSTVDIPAVRTSNHQLWLLYAYFVSTTCWGAAFACAGPDLAVIACMSRCAQRYTHCAACYYIILLLNESYAVAYTLS